MTKLRVLPNPAAPELDRRTSPRIPEALAVRAEVTLSADGPERVGEVAECITRDISSSGLLLRADQDLPVGCGLDLHLCIAGRDEPLTLQAQVKWNCADSENQEFLLGIELRGQPTDEYRAWCERVREHMNEQDF